MHDVSSWHKARKAIADLRALLRICDADAAPAVQAAIDALDAAFPIHYTKG